MAHEIGHHLNNNIFSKDRMRQSDELKADKFAGYVLCRLGLKLTDAQRLIETVCPLLAEGYYPPRSSRIEAFSIGFKDCSGSTEILENPEFGYRVKSLLYKLPFNSTIKEVLSYEYGPQSANTFNYESLPRAIECTGQDIRYYWRYLKDSKFNPEIYSYLVSNGLKDKVTNDSYIVWLFKENKLERIALRLFSSSADFEPAFFMSLGQNIQKYPLRYQTVVDGIHYMSGSSFTDVKSTEIYIANDDGYNFCIHDWWHK